MAGGLGVGTAAARSSSCSIKSRGGKQESVPVLLLYDEAFQALRLPTATNHHDFVRKRQGSQ